MPRTVITAQAISSAYYPVTPLTANSADVAFTGTSDATDRYASLVDGKTLVLVKNTDTVNHNITIASVADPSFNRKGDITAYVLGAGEVALFGPFKTIGWGNSGQLWLDVDDPKLTMAILTLP